MRKCLCRFIAPLLIFCSGCTSQPSPTLPEQTPAATLEFERIAANADNINHIALHYRISAENPRTVPLDIEIRGWKLTLNDRELDDTAAALTLDGAGISGARISAGAQTGVTKTVVLELDLQALPALPALPEQFDSADGHEYLAQISLDLAYRYPGDEPHTGTIQASASFPRIREPEFTITSIAILQAELINTRFKVHLRIDNPNSFPLELSSFEYELYGEGRFWANGRERDVLRIPALGSAETELFLTMNFIDMKRQLLDEIIAMRQVRYRFTGETEVGTGVSWLPRFNMGFDHSGNSKVLR
jgi:LEA14-like dessication related protein